MNNHDYTLIIFQAIEPYFGETCDILFAPSETKLDDSFIVQSAFSDECLLIGIAKELDITDT